MTAWIFILVLNLPSFGGQVVAQVEAVDQASCEKLRRVVIQQFGGEANIHGSISVCQPSVKR